MGAVSQDGLVSPAAVSQLGDQVPHGAGSDQQCRSLAGPVRRQRFEAVDGGVFPEHIVSNLGRCHGLPHGRGGAGDGVRSQIDALHGWSDPLVRGVRVERRT